MNNIICGYRKMTGLTQKEMAEKLNISEGTYRNKEKGKSSFKYKEMVDFHEIISKKNLSVTINDIFFDSKPTKTDV